MIAVGIIIGRTIIAIIVDNCLIAIIKNKGYTGSGDKAVFSKSSLMTFLFVIIDGIL